MMYMTDFPARGFVYMLTRAERYLEECRISINSLRQHVPDAHVTIITTENMVGLGYKTALQEMADYVAVVQEAQSVVHQADLNGKEWRVGLRFKARNMYTYTPYEQALFLDTDTYILTDIRHLFNLTHVYDLALASSPSDLRPILRDDMGHTSAHVNNYNTGVILFKKCSEPCPVCTVERNL